jgi:hypothetical protein
VTPDELTSLVKLIAQLYGQLNAASTRAATLEAQLVKLKAELVAAQAATDPPDPAPDSNE